MADPTKYTPGYDFSNYQANQPNKPLPGDRLDIELADIADSLDSTIEALKDVRRADGKLQNGIVDADSFTQDLVDDLAQDVIVAVGPAAEASIQAALPDWRGGWLTATAYAVNDLARQDGSAYICLTAHTSGTFTTDLAAGRWELFAQRGAAGAGTGDMVGANNLSDVTDAAVARSNIGLGSAAVADASDFQAADADLAALAALSTTGYLRRTGDGTAAAQAAASTAQITGLTGNAPVEPAGIATAAVLATPTGSSNWAPDWSVFLSASWTINAARTLQNPTNVIPGTTRVVRIAGNDATARAVSYGSAYKGGLPASVTSTAVALLTLYAVSSSEIVVAAVEYVA